MPIQCRLCNKKQIPFQLLFQVGLVSHSAAPEKGEEGTFLVVEAMGTGAAGLQWENFAVSVPRGGLCWSFCCLYKPLRRTSKSSCKARLGTRG